MPSSSSLSAVARKRFGLVALLAVHIGGVLGACQCAGLKEGVSYMSEASFGVALNAIWGSSPGDVWAVGNRGTLLHWAGSWTAVEKMTNADLFAVRGRSASDLWVAGARGTVLHWDGIGWVPEHAPTQRDLTGIAFGEDGGVWVVGADGTILSTLR